MGWFSDLAGPALGAGVGFLIGGPAGAAIGGSIGAGVTSAKAAKDANSQNVSLQRETNDVQIELANTAHQREIADLKKAGLNPILSSKYGGAASPGLTAPSVSSLAPVWQNSASSVQNAYLSTQNLAADLQVKKTQALAYSAQAVSTGEEARRRAMENDVLEMESQVRKYESTVRARRPGWIKSLGIGLKDTGETLQRFNPFSGIKIDSGDKYYGR